ncbi:Carboxylesterase family [Popillia japonica]|uniref:Carboxylic ester hydrolase n=1 Tax=Popillia japonica TaxID=7064 RepID=A0AAW1IBR9_POPJA
MRKNIAIIFILFNAIKAQEPLVEISQGVLRGTVLVNRDGGNFYGFRSIPYAQPPLNELRFKAPVPAGGWEGIRDAADDPPVCTQSLAGLFGQEDCLYVNVFIPELPSMNSTKKPVMAYIHGGGFTTGGGTSSLAGPAFLMTKEVILVTFQYRLGVFGFIDFEDPELGVSGNAGMKDQVLALKWIKENIAKFGGDPDNILIFGTSAGGLFSKVIGQSGVALAPSLTGYGGSNTGVAFAEHLGLQTANLTETLSTLRELSAAELLTAEESIPANSSYFPGPNIELLSNEEAFLTQRPIDILLSGDYNDVLYLTGINNMEGLLYETSALAETGQSILIEDFAAFIHEDLEIAAYSEEASIVAERIKEFYYGDTEPTRDDIIQAVDLWTDFLFGFPAYRAALEHSKKSADVYFYYFTVDTPLNLKNLYSSGVQEYPGASHTDEITYMFETFFTPIIEDGSVEDLVIRSVVTLWTNFAIFGNPTPDDSLGFKWEPVSEDAFNYLDIGTYTNNAFVNPRAENFAFWSQIYDEFFPRR